MYIGVNNVARKVNTCYVGVDGKARKVKAIYVGVNNIARLVWQSINNVSKYLTCKLYDTNVSSGISNNYPGSYHPFGYELYQRKNVYPMCTSKIFGLITVNDNGEIISTQRLSKFDLDMSRKNTIIVDDNNYYSMSLQSDYRYHLWYNSSTDSTYSYSYYTTNTSLNCDNMIATGDGYLIGVSSSPESYNQYKCVIMYPYSSNIGTWTTEINKQYGTLSPLVSLIMLTPTSGVIYEAYPAVPRYYLKSFSKSGTTINIEKIVEISQLNSTVSLYDMRMIDKNHFFVFVNNYLMYYLIDDNYNISLIDYIPMQIDGYSKDSCRIGKTNSFALINNYNKNTKIISFDDKIIDNGEYTSSASRGSYHIFPFGEKSLITFSYSSKYGSGYLSSYVETFE